MDRLEGSVAMAQAQIAARLPPEIVAHFSSDWLGLSGLKWPQLGSSGQPGQVCSPGVGYGSSQAPPGLCGCSQVSLSPGKCFTQERDMMRTDIDICKEI